MKKRFLISIIVLFIVPMLIINIVTRRVYESNLSNKFQKANLTNMGQTISIIDSIIERQVAAINILSVDPGLIRKLCSTNANSEWKEYEDFQSIKNQLHTIRSTILYSYKTETSIIGFNGRTYHTVNNEIGNLISNSLESEWVEQIIELEGAPLWFTPASSYIDTSKLDSNYLLVGQLIKDNVYRGVGVIILGIAEESSIRPALKNAAKAYGGNLILLNEKDQVISSSFEEYVGKHLEDLPFQFDTVEEYGNDSIISYGTCNINDRKHFVNYGVAGTIGWKLVQFIPYDEIFKELIALRKISLIAIAVLSFILIFVAVLYSTGITKPLKILSDHSHLISQGKMEVINDVCVERKDEIGTVVRAFNKMVNNISQLIQQIHNEQKIRTRTYLEVLCAQINPHFLLNTLDSIKWMAVMAGNENVSKMLSSLGYILEISFRNGDEFITIEKEIEAVEKYIELQKMRYNKFEFIKDIDDSIKNSYVPKLILQPIVENCIIHGFEDMNYGGLILLTGSLDNNNICFIIEDNGKGMPDKMLGKYSICSSTKKNDKGIGIENVNQRLKIYYGEEYGVYIDDRKGGGTRIKILMPYVGGENSAKNINSR